MRLFQAMYKGQEIWEGYYGVVNSPKKTLLEPVKSKKGKSLCNIKKP